MNSDFSTNKDLIDTQSKFSFIDSFSEPVLVFTEKGEISRVNPATINLIKTQSEQPANWTSIYTLIPELSHQMHLPFKDSKYHPEHSILKFPCSGFSIEVTPHFNGDEHLMVLHSKLDDALNADFLQLVLESIPARVFWKDRNGTYLGCNTKFAGDAGKHSQAELIGLNDSDVFPIEGHLLKNLRPMLPATRPGFQPIKCPFEMPTETLWASWAPTPTLPIEFFIKSKWSTWLALIT